MRWPWKRRPVDLPEVPAPQVELESARERAEIKRRLSRVEKEVAAMRDVLVVEHRMPERKGS